MIDGTDEIYLQIEDIHKRLHRLSELVAATNKEKSNNYNFQYLSGKQQQLCNTANHVKDQLIFKIKE